MKGNIKKLAVLVVIVAIAMFFVWAMASADDLKGKKSIRGQYTGTGGGTCIIAPGGFYENPPDPPAIDLTPKCPPPNLPAGTACAIVQWFSREGDYTFEHKGKGTVTSTGRVVAQSFSPSGVLLPPYAGGLPYAGVAEVKFDFTYTVDDSGMVTITQKPGTYFSEWTSGPATGKIFKSEGWEYTGSITPDGKVMNLASGAPVILTLQQLCPSDCLPPNCNPCPGVPLTSMICNFDTVLIWQHE